MNRFAASFAIAAICALATPAHAAEVRAWDERAFAMAQAEGKPILIEVHAPWCPVCSAQGKAIQKLASRDLVIFRIDYDSQKPVWQRFGAQKQSTLIAFRGKRETGRLAYQTDEAKISALLASTAG